jgi:hypothetical protein
VNFARDEIDTSPRSRGDKRVRVVASSAPKRAWGMPGGQHTRSLVCAEVEHTSKSTTVAPEITRHSRTRMVLTVSFVLFPETGLCCLRHLRDHRLASLTPASGRQNHTTSPSAWGAFVSHTTSVHRIPCPTFVTIGQTPLLSGRDGGITKGVSSKRRSGIFLLQGLDKMMESPRGG